MEDLRIDVADVGLGGVVNRRIQLRFRRAALGLERDAPPVADRVDDALQVGAEDLCVRVPQTAERCLGRVAVGVVRADGDDGVVRHDLAQEDIARRSGAAVMPDLEDRRVQPRAGFDQLVLRRDAHVSGEEEACLAVVDAQDNGIFIVVFIVAQRAEHGDLRLAEREGVSGGRNFDGAALLVRVFHKVGKRLRAIFRGARPDVLRRELRQHAREAADVIFVTMRVDDIVQRRDAVLLEAGDDIARVVDVAAVDEHGLSITDEQTGIRLPHIEEPDVQFAVWQCNLRFAVLRAAEHPPDEQRRQHQHGKNGGGGRGLTPILFSCHRAPPVRA